MSLRALDYFRATGLPPDPRLEEAIGIVKQRCHQNGRWPLNILHPERIPIEMETGTGSASRWTTLRAAARSGLGYLMPTSIESAPASGSTCVSRNPASAHPARAVSAGEVKAAGCLDQHVQAHQQAGRVAGAVIVDQAFIDQQRSARRQRFIGLRDEHALGFQIPVVQDVSHHDDVHVRQGVLEEAAGSEPDAFLQAVRLDIFLEDGAHLRQVVTDAAEVRIQPRDLHRGVALCRAHIGERGVIRPGELLPDGDGRSPAEARHRLQEFTQPRRVRVERFEHSRAAAADFVLRQARAQPFGEPSPRTGRAGGWPSPACRRCTTSCACPGTGPSLECSGKLRRSAIGKPSATSASRKSRCRARVQAQPPL